jgi:hypothetical protein
MFVRFFYVKGIKKLNPAYTSIGSLAGKHGNKPHARKEFRGPNGGHNQHDDIPTGALLLDEGAQFLIVLLSARKISLRQPLADRLQFLPTLCACFGVGHSESFERIEDNLGHDQASVLFVIGRNDIPG